MIGKSFRDLEPSFKVSGSVNGSNVENIYF